MAKIVARMVVWFVVSTFSIGFALLSDGLAGGKVSSLPRLWRDLVTLNPEIFLRAMWWLMVLLPFVFLLAILRASRNEKKS